MRIALYTPNYPGLTGEGGIGTYTKAIAHGLCELGHEIHVLTPGDRPSTSDGQVRVHFTRTDHFPAADKVFPGAGACWRVGRAMRRLVRDYNLDVVEFPNWEGYGLLFLKTARVPMVVRFRHLRGRHKRSTRDPEPVASVGCQAGEMAGSGREGTRDSLGRASPHNGRGGRNLR